MRINIKEFIRSEARSRVMILLGCDEKFIFGKASDFEYFDLWERILPLAEGHAAVIEYGCELQKLGLSLPDEPYSRDRSIDRWQKLNSIFCDDFLYCKRTYASPLKKAEASSVESDVPYGVYDLRLEAVRLLPLHDSLTNMCEAIFSKIKNDDFYNIKIRLDVRDGEYICPNPYLAERIFSKKKEGMILPNGEDNLLLFQLLILLILDLGKAKKITVEFFGQTENALEFVSYLSKRGLFCGEARVELAPDKSLSDFASRAVELYPDIWLRPMVSGRISMQMRSEYPISAIYFLTKTQ